MSNEAALTIVLGAKDEASAILGKTGKSFDALEGSVGKLNKATGLAKAAMGAFTGVLASGVVGVLSDAARAAAEDEANVVKLRTAVEASGASWDENAAAIEERIKKGQELAFSDTDTRDSIAKLTTATGSVTKATELQSLAWDISRARGIKLGEATDIVTKAALGQFGPLKKIGIVLDENSTATEALAELQKRHAGQSEAYGKTTSAAIFKVKDSIGEWQEQLGTVLGPAQGVIGILPGLSSGMSIASGAIGGISTMIKATFIPSLIAMAIPFAPILIAIAAVALAAGLLALAWSNNWGDIRGKTAAAMDFLQNAFDGVRLFILNVWKGIVSGIAAAVNGVIGIINGFIDTYNFLAEKLGLPLIGKISLLTPNLEAVDAQINQIARDREARVIVNEYPGSRSATPGHGMYARGTDHITRGPEWFVAGEGGMAERVQVTPLGGGGAPAAGGVNVYLTVQGSLIGLDERDIADRIGKVFLQRRRLAGLA